MINRLDQTLKAPFNLREIYTDVSLQGVVASAVQAPAIALVPMPFNIVDVDHAAGSTMIETRWQVVAVLRSFNDQGRATRAADEGGQLVVEIIRQLSNWSPAPGFERLLLRSVQTRQHVKQKLFIPLVFGSATTIKSVNTSVFD